MKIQKVSQLSLGVSVLDVGVRGFLKQETDWFKDIRPFIKEYNEIVSCYNRLDHDLSLIYDVIKDVYKQANKIMLACSCFNPNKKTTESLSKKEKSKQAKKLEQTKRKSVKTLRHQDCFFIESYPIDRTIDDIQFSLESVGKDIEKLQNMFSAFIGKYSGFKKLDYIDHGDYDILYQGPTKDVEDAVARIQDIAKLIEEYRDNEFVKINDRFNNINNKEERTDGNSIVDMYAMNTMIEETIRSIKNEDVIHGIYQVGSSGQRIANAIVEIYCSQDDDSKQIARSQLYLDAPKIDNDKNQM